MTTKRCKTGLLLAAAGLAFTGGCAVSVPSATIGLPNIAFQAPVVYTPPVVAVTPPAVVYTPPAVTVAAPAVVYNAPAVAVAPAQPAPAAAPAADPQLDQLVAPIALYPDPLLAQLLPAATYPDQVQAAGQWLASTPSPSDDAIEAQPWSPNVKALLHYPTAVQVLNNDPQWTQSLGSAFNSNPASVMAAIQDMRAQAQAAGNLAATAQIKVIADAGVISIQPLEITAPVFVPVYDPVVVYASPVAITWGTPYVVGPWLGYGVDWYGGAVFAGPWYGGWYHDGYWGRDRAWRYDHYHDGWRHDDRFGRAPHMDRSRYAVARGIHGRESSFRQGLTQHAAAVNRSRGVARTAMASRSSGGLQRDGQRTAQPRSTGQQHSQGGSGGVGAPGGQRPGGQAGAAPKAAGSAPKKK